MPQAKYDLLRLPPIRVILGAAAFLGRLAQQRLSDRVSDRAPWPPLAAATGDHVPYATALEGWITREQAHRLSAKLQQAKQNLENERAKVKRLEASLIVMNAMTKSGHTTAALSDLSHQWEATYKSNKELKEANSELTLRLEKSEARLKEKEKADQAEAASHGGHRVREEKLAEILRAAFPKLDFMHKSAYFLMQKAHSMGNTLRRLRELNDTGQLGGAKRVQNSSWLEVKFGTDGSSADRLYYAESCQPGRFVVVLSNKNMQEHDLRRLQQIR